MIIDKYLKLYIFSVKDEIWSWIIDIERIKKLYM